MQSILDVVEVGPHACHSFESYDMAVWNKACEYYDIIHACGWTKHMGHYLV